MKLGKGFILQDDYDTSCIKCGIEQNIIDFSISVIPKKVILHSIGWCDFRVLECPNCKQKAIQYIEFAEK